MANRSVCRPILLSVVSFDITLAYSVELFHCVMTAPQHQTLSVRLVFHSLVVSLVMSRLDYGNTTLAGLPASQLRRLQSVLNAPVRLIYRSSRSEHVTPMLRDLQWLWSPERIDFKLAVLICRCLHGLAP